MCFIKIIGSFYGSAHRIAQNCLVFVAFLGLVYTRSAILRIGGYTIYIIIWCVRSIIVEYRIDKCINVFISIVFAMAIMPFLGGFFLVGERPLTQKKKNGP